MPLSTSFAALRRFARATDGAVTADIVVLTGGLLGLAMIVLGSVTSELETLTEDTNRQLHRVVMSPDFDDAPCPQGWAFDHAANTGMTVAAIHDWYDQEDETSRDDDVLQVLNTYHANPRDFRHRKALKLARLQIMMCIAEDRRLTLS